MMLATNVDDVAAAPPADSNVTKVLKEKKKKI